MAHTDTCKIEVCQEIERRKEAAGGLKPAIRQISKEMGIPQGTLVRWYWPEGQKKYCGIKNDTATLAVPVVTCAETDLQSLIESGKKFKTIYADPPWKYSNQATRSSTNNHYQTLTVKEISRLPIKDLLEDNAHLHLWTTNAFLFDAKSVIESWGFEYKSCLIWVKPQLGIGNYWRLSHEFLLLGVRGSMTFSDHSIKSWVEADRTKHSAKPEVVREFIERVSPGPYLELFGRRTAEKWTVWGNEIERELFNGSAFDKASL